MFSEDMDLAKSPYSLLVGSPDPHPFACVMLYSGASYPSAWADQVVCGNCIPYLVCDNG